MRHKQRIKPFLKYIEEKWESMPDLRFGQLLINLGIVEDSLLTWNWEISDYNISHEDMREIQYWGVWDIKNSVHKFIPIKELSFNHIINILETQTHISNKLRTLFEVELGFRRSNK